MHVTSSEFKCWVIIPAAGMGSRMASDRPKQYMKIHDQTMIEHTIQPFIQLDWIEKIFVAIAEDDHYWHQLSISSHENIEIISGGKERIDSVMNALAALQNYADKDDYIFVHDAARPCLHVEDLEKLYAEMQKTESGVILADKISDTLKKSRENQQVDKTISREDMWRALTPQVFKNELLLNAFEFVQQNKSVMITDEASAVEALGRSPTLLQGRTDNIKVTKQQDMQLAAIILQQK